MVFTCKAMLRLFLKPTLKIKSTLTKHCPSWQLFTRNNSQVLFWSIELNRLYINKTLSLYDTDENMFVKKSDLESLITSLHGVTPTRVENDINSGIQDMTIDDKPIDIAQHFHVVDAFDMPRMYYDIRRKGFVK